MIINDSRSFVLLSSCNLKLRTPKKDSQIHNEPLPLTVLFSIDKTVIMSKEYLPSWAMSPNVACVSVSLERVKVSRCLHSPVLFASYVRTFFYIIARD